MNLFTTQPAGSWVKQEAGKPAPFSLFGDFWQQHELCLLFADCNLGKSLLAVQMADGISRARSIGPFGTAPHEQTVLYIDCKLTAAQFTARYISPYGQTYNFSSGFQRAEFDLCADLPSGLKSYDDLLIRGIETAVASTRAQVLIIDNLGSLCSSTEKPANAFAIMRGLRALKLKLGLSILVLVQTPRRNTYNPVSQADLQANKTLLNWADSAFAIGESHTETGTRYLKQIKRRGGAIVYDSQNVCLMQPVKTDSLLHFEFTGQATEAQHLRRPGEQERHRMAQEAAELSRQGQTQRQISLKLRISPSTVNKLLHMSGIHPEANEPGAFKEWPDTWPTTTVDPHHQIFIESLYSDFPPEVGEEKLQEYDEYIDRYMELPNGKGKSLGEVRMSEYQNVDWARTFPLQKIVMRGEELTAEDEALLLQRANWKHEYNW